MIRLHDDAEVSDRLLARIAKADREASLPGHSCGGTVAGALQCEKCLNRKPTVSLPSYRAHSIISEADYAAALAEYTGAAWVERAEKEAAYQQNRRRICVCGHSYTEHSEPCGDDYTNCHMRSGYGWCGCIKFRER